MAQVIVRNLDDEVVRKLRQQAKRKGRPLEQELREILTRAAKPTRQEIVQEMARIPAMTPRRLTTDSTDMIREDRDRR